MKEKRKFRLKSELERQICAHTLALTAPPSSSGLLTLSLSLSRHSGEQRMRLMLLSHEMRSERRRRRSGKKDCLFSSLLLFAAFCSLTWCYVLLVCLTHVRTYIHPSLTDWRAGGRAAVKWLTGPIRDTHAYVRTPTYVGVHRLEKKKTFCLRKFTSKLIWSQKFRGNEAARPS